VAIANLPLVDAIVSGIPCQPDARNGRMLGRGDDRSRVGEHVVQAIIFQAKAGSLLFFVIEDVANIAGRLGLLSLIQERFEEIKHLMLITVIQANARIHGGLPQSRRRLFIVGLRRFVIWFGRNAVEDRLPSRIPKVPMNRLRDFLDLSLPSEEASLCPTYQANLAMFKDTLRPKLSDDRCVGTTAVFNVGRRPGGYHGSITFDYTGAMQCTDNEKYILALGEGYAPSLSRRLSPLEKASLQGFKASSCGGLGKTALDTRLERRWRPRASALSSRSP
jgi:site-specific DNA-cytosine methylase